MIFFGRYVADCVYRITVQNSYLARSGGIANIGDTDDDSWNAQPFKVLDMIVCDIARSFCVD